MLDVEGIDVHYGPVQALFGVGLHVGEAEMVALLGANGAGKTTTLRTISGLIAPSRGEVRIDGKPIGGMPAQKVVRLGVAHLPEGRELFPELTVVENLRLGYWSKRKDKRGFDGKLEHVYHLFPRMQERAQQAAGTLSGGEQQMLAVGRALMSSPRLLLVDEVSLGLAPIVVSSLFAALEEVNRQGTAVLLVEQFVHLALKHTSRAYVLGKGEVVIEGKSSELLASPELMAAYLGEMEEKEEPALVSDLEVVEVIDLTAVEPVAEPPLDLAIVEEPDRAQEPEPEPSELAVDSAPPVEKPAPPKADAKPKKRRAPRPKKVVPPEAQVEEEPLAAEVVLPEEPAESAPKRKPAPKRAKKVPSAP